MPLLLRTASTPLAPLNVVSNGNVISVSTSSGAIPGASVMTTTRGRFKFGNTSIGNCKDCHAPTPSMIAATASTISRLFSEK